MTTYNRSSTAQTSGTTSTQNVTTADTVVFTVSGGASTYSIITGSNCTRNKTSMSSGESLTITFGSSSAGSYTCSVGGFTTDKEPLFVYAVIGGTVSLALTQITITSGAISLGDLRTFFGDSGSLALGDLYKGGSLVPNHALNTSVPLSGAIDLADFYGVYKL